MIGFGSFANEIQFNEAMNRIKTVILMLCLALSGAFCYANDVTGIEFGKKGEGDEIPLEVKENTFHGGLDKSSSILASIDGHYLTIAFTENLGQVAVEITTAAGGYVQTSSCLTPNGLQFYIPLAGDYIVTFTLPNGDEYYGEFTVTD